MSRTRLDIGRKTLAVASVVEIGTGVALLIAPRFVPAMLLGADLTAVGASALRSMLVYNVLIAVFLAYLFTVEHIGGVLLWPAAALHAIVATLLYWASSGERQT